MDCRLNTHHQLPENKKKREGYEFCFNLRSCNKLQGFNPILDNKFLQTRPGLFCFPKRDKYLIFMLQMLYLHCN